MDTLLVIGAESTVGANVACTLADAFQVVGLSRSAAQASVAQASCLPDILDGCRTIACEFTQGELGRWIEDVGPSWIIFSGALSRSSWDEADVPAPWLAAEPQLASAVAAAAQGVGARLTLISTDGVFAGPQMFHSEHSTTCSASPLAEAALAAEQAVMQTLGGAALVVRTHAYGWSPIASEAGFAERFCQTLNDGLSVAADAHRHATPILATDLAGLVHAAYRANLHGMLHIAGAERTSPRRFAHELAVTLGVGRRLPSAAAEVGWQRAKETSLISRRAQQALEQPLPMLREGLKRFVAQLDNGYRDRIRSEEEALVPARAA
jgi:dTDP-4-dehydrorhamnose reductase